MVTDDSVGDDAGGGELVVHPARRATVAVADPSLTSTVQSAGAVNPSRWSLKRPAPSLVPIATVSTVIVRFGVAVPSILSWLPTRSARDTVTVAWATAGRSATPVSTRHPRTMRRASRTVHARVWARRTHKPYGLRPVSDRIMCLLVEV